MFERIPLTLQLIIGGAIIIPASFVVVAWALICVSVGAGRLLGLH